jgi:hypothetical protein
MENFGTVIEFSLAGFQDDKILRQWIESPANPIVHPLIDRPAATFVTRHAGDGRVDNVLLSIKSKSQSKTDRVAVVPKIHILTCERLELLYRPHSYGPRPGQQIAHACRRAAQQQSRELHVVGRGGIHSLSTAWRSVRRGVGTLFRPVATGKPISRNPHRTFARCRNAFGRSSRVLEELEVLWNHELELPGSARVGRKVQSRLPPQFFNQLGNRVIRW